MMTGDGGLFTLFLKECFEELDEKFTFNNLVEHLTNKRIEVEHFSRLTSDCALLDLPFIHK